MTAIRIQNLTKYYKRFLALDDFSLEIQEGEFFGLLGPNGAGKTTTISALTGLANYSQGSIEVFGFDVKKQYRDARRQIGLVPQEFNFDPFLSAQQILTFEAGYFGLTSKQAKMRSEELLKRFDLWSKRDGGYKKLSGGMKRRLLIARALVHKPKVLILDEPTAGVDVQLRYELWDFLKEENKRGTTIILTTHYIEEAEKLCQRIGVMNQGKLIDLDTVDQLVMRISGEQVAITLEKEPGESLTGLEELGVRYQEGAYLFSQTPGKLQEVLDFFHTKNLVISKIDTRRASLEDAFMKLTRENT